MTLQTCFCLGYAPVTRTCDQVPTANPAWTLPCRIQSLEPLSAEEGLRHTIVYFDELLSVSR